jgi:polysaccharide export outer membrane protein
MLKSFMNLFTRRCVRRHTGWLYHIEVPLPASFCSQNPRLLSRAMALLVCSGMTACSSTYSSLPPIESAPLPSQSPMLPSKALYLLRIGDVIGIKFPLNPELNDEVTVGPDGRISTADAPDVWVVGTPTSAVATELRKRYRSVLNDPRLSVEIKSFAQAPIFVGGEIQAPGEYQGDTMPPTLSQAIARAGGVKLSGNTARVFVIRRGADDKATVYSTRYADIVKGDGSSDIRLAPYDLVYVPRTTVAEAFVYWNQYVQQFVPVNWGFNYQFNDQSSFTPTTTK